MAGEAARPLPWLRFVVVAALIGLDLWTKAAVFAWLEGDPVGVVERDHCGHWRYPLAGEWLAFMVHENPGAAFGRFGDWPRTLVFGRVVAVIVLAIALWRTKREHTLLLWGVVLVAAGAAGNLYDNLFLSPPETGPNAGHPFGLVRDFIDVYFGIWDWHFPTFNVADSCITVGAVCFLLYSFVHKEEGEEADSGSTVAETSG